MKITITIFFLLINISTSSQPLTSIEHMKYESYGKKNYNNTIVNKGDPKNILAYFISSSGDTSYINEIKFDKINRHIQDAYLEDNRNIVYVNEYYFDSLGNITLELTRGSKGNIQWGKKYIYNDDSTEVIEKNVDTNKTNFTKYRYDNDNRLLEIIQGDINCPCIETEIRNYAKNGTLISIIGLENNCVDTIYKNELVYDEWLNLLEEKSFITIRNKLKLQYVLKFKYDKKNNKIEKIVQWHNKKSNGKTIFDYDSQNRKISERFITNNGKEDIISSIEYKGSMVVRTFYEDDGIVKLYADSLKHFSLKKKFNKRNKLIYSRKEEEILDDCGNFIKLNIDFFEKNSLWFTRTAKMVMERKIQYFEE